MSDRSKVIGFMEKIFMVGTALFLSRIVPLLPQEVVYSLLHCAAVSVTAILYAISLLMFLLGKQ